MDRNGCYRLLRIALAVWAAGTIATSLAEAWQGDDVQRQPPAKSPAESLLCMRTHDHLRIELVAAEPLIADPVAIDFGPDGRLWVVEMTDYARGVNDDFAPGGNVKFLTDTDDDGRYDRSSLFLTGLRFPTDVKVWREGVLICDAPDILFAADTDGDGKADLRRKLYSGFATHNPHARVNSLRYGLDNWLYGSGGLFGGRITNADGRTVDVTNRDFRIQPDLGVIEPVNGQTQQGRSRDDWDNWFGCTNDSLLEQYPVDDRYARRNPHVAPPTPIVVVPDYPNFNQLFPLGDLVLFKLSGAPGRPTSACGAEIYRDELLGAEFSGNAFTCEPVNQLVHRLTLHRKGATFSGRRPTEEIDREFLASTDRWFRPVQARTGPDGALWIVDMYRYVIEHPQWIPPETTAELNLFAGQGFGRIYRVVRRDAPARRPLRLDHLNDEQLAAALDSPNGVQRDLAQQMLVERKATAAHDSLAKVMRDSRWPAARVQAASTLAGLQKLVPSQILPLLEDEVAEVRRHGVRLSEPFLNQSPELLAAALRRVDDPAMEVRLQLANSLGECRDERAATALAALGINAQGDPYLTGAVLSSVGPRNVVQVLQAGWLPSDERSRPEWLEPLLATAAATDDATIVATAVGRIAERPAARRSSWIWSVLARALDAADRRELNLGTVAPVTTRQRIAEIYADAGEALRAVGTAEPDRIAAIRLLGRHPGVATRSLLGTTPPLAADPIASLLATRFSPTIQSAAVAGLARLAGASPAGASIPHQLLARWPDATPRLRAEMLDTLLSRDEWLPALLAAVEQGIVKPGELDAARRQKLLLHKVEAIKQRAEKLLAASASSSRQELMAAWQSALSLPGQKSRGRELFQKRCAACHQLDGTGFQVGPDLAALTNKTAASMLVAILDPNRDVDGRYISYTASLVDGRTISGLLVNETGNSVTLREQGGKDHVLLRGELEELRATGKSVMPEGLEKDLTHQDFADLAAYLVPPRALPGSIDPRQPAIAADIARFLLDDSQPVDARQKLIAEQPQLAAEVIEAIVADLPRDANEEYRRIPWIWRVAIDCGSRNQTEELRAVLNSSLPLGGQPLRDWQAVAIGGGLIQGVSQAGEWPKPRIEGVIKVEGILVARWLRTVELASALADDEQVPTGTRYDALRMVAMGPWDLCGGQLRKYLAPGVDGELQMGAVSGLADIQHPEATAALVRGLGHLTKRNRELALDGLLRSPERCLALLAAVESGDVTREQLGPTRASKLLEHAQREVQVKARQLLSR